MIEIEENKTEEDIIKERDKQERKELIDFILELFDIEKPTGLILKQIKNLHEEYGYRYKAIALTLDYFLIYKIIQQRMQEELELCHMCMMRPQTFIKI
ncbi:hypothetical protein UM818_01800 [Staphylococcus aureus]|nr:hypothetical protein UM818_01800 [Staphylococcus aureus]